MAEADGPVRLLEVCGQRFARFLHDAEYKRLAWLREVEEQGMRMLESNFGAEPELMPKTPSQRRRPRKRQSSCLREDNKEPNRRRLSRRRSSIKPVLFKPSSQQCLSKEPPLSPGCQGEQAAVPDSACKSPASIKAELLAQTGEWPAETSALAVRTDCQGCPWSADSGSTACEAGTGQEVPEGDAAPELHDAAPVPVIPTAGEKEAPKRGASTSTPKTARNGDLAVLHGDKSPQGLEKVLFHDSESKRTPGRSKTRRCSGHRSLVGGLHKSHRASLAEKYSLVSKRESMIRRSISRAMSRKAAARESSLASSRVSCQSSLEVFAKEDVTSSARPGLEPNPPSEKSPEDILVSSSRAQAANPPTRHSPPLELHVVGTKGSGVNPNSGTQNGNREQARDAKSQENPKHVWTRSCKQAMGALWNRPQLGGHPLSPLDGKHKNSANQTPSSSSSASKVVRPLKNFLQAVQQNQLLASPGRGGVVKNFIRRNTPTRPDLKGDFVERERQRLESLRKKQEAEEQRKNKVEEEKRRRQAEMKQKREERLRKALQARERVEQMEEEKKKRMEQKILHTDEKVRVSQARDEKASEERSKKKLSKKLGEGDARKQEALKGEEEELEQQEPLQKRREDEVKERGKKVLELRNAVEQRQVEHMRDHKLRGKEKVLQAPPESAVFTEKDIKEKESPKELLQLPGQAKRAKQPESIAVASNPWLRAVKEKVGLGEPQELGEEKKMKHPEALTAASGTWLSKTLKGSISTSYLASPKGTKESMSSAADENNYGMDLNSDDSTDDENDPRKPVPAWADGSQLNQAILHQYYHPMNVDQIFGLIPSPKLEDIFGKSKPRYFKRTSSAVWHSPPETKSACGPTCNFKH